MPPNVRPPRLAALLVASALAGCPGPRIRSFTVEPASACAGEGPAVARWDARGDLALEVRLDPGAGEGPGPAGDLPPGAHVVQLRLTAAKPGEPATAAATAWVAQLPDRFDEEVAFSTELAPGGVVARGEKNPARWNDRFVVDAVAALDGRTLTVTHAGRTAAVGPSPSDAFAGTPLAGPWALELRAAQPLPERLAVRATVRCRRAP